MSATDSAAGAGLTLVLGVILVTASGGILLGILGPVEQPTQTRFSVSTTPSGWLVMTHRGGPPLDVRSLRVQVVVNGTPLARQPPIPFFAATGFRGGPRGPFNAAADPRWTVGERAAFRVASTNRPAFAPGARVTVRLYREGALLWSGHSVVGDSRH